MTDAEALALESTSDLDELMQRAAQLRNAAYGPVITYSRKVFVPLTQLCRDVCHYCVFARTPRQIEQPYLDADAVVALVKRAREQGCKEALFTLGERPELRYAAARNALQRMGYASTLDYLQHVAARVLDETGVLPHLNAGTMTADEIRLLRPVSASMGIMLESASERLCGKGMPHHGSPDKHPAARLETMRLCGEANVPFTTGILIGIGETRRERIESLLALRALHARYGHIQEVIVQNFRAKPGTLMANAPEPAEDEMLWTVAAARLIMACDVSIQAPPNLSPGLLQRLIRAGINDWGGVSPVTPDHVNPEAPWPHLDQLARETAATGKTLEERLTIYPSYALEPERWLAPHLHTTVLRHRDAEGYARVDDWLPGATVPPPSRELEYLKPMTRSATHAISRLVERACSGTRLAENEVEQLLKVRGDDLAHVCSAADALRLAVCGDRVGYVVNRNINYTNVCYFKCRFCAFSKGKLSVDLRGQPYDLTLDEVERRVAEAWQRGATEVCMQGGIHPDYDGTTYLNILAHAKAAAPGMHVHAYSPLEVWQGAKTLGLDIDAYLRRLRAAGLGTLPGTAAEILDDAVRAILCPDKLSTGEWLSVMETAHRVGLRTTATIMFGHIEQPLHCARHLLRVRDLQARTGGFTEFVPLPFVGMEAPIYRKGAARSGPTFRESLLMHAVARLVLHPLIPNIQVSWVKMGEAGARACLQAGANDLGGTLMNESITRAAGAVHGQELPPTKMDALIESAGRQPYQRTTLYASAPAERVAASYRAQPLAASVNSPLRKLAHRASAKPETATGHPVETISAAYRETESR